MQRLLLLEYLPKQIIIEILNIYFQAAESGNLDDFNRLFIAEPARLEVRDSKGRAAVHQAAARNKLNILKFIRNHGGGKYYTILYWYVIFICVGCRYIVRERIASRNLTSNLD